MYNIHTCITIINMHSVTLAIFYISGNSGVVCNICSRDVLFTNYYVHLHVVNAWSFTCMYYVHGKAIHSVKLNYCWSLNNILPSTWPTCTYVHLHVYVHTYIHVTAAGDVLWVCVQWADDCVWWQCWSGVFLEHHQHPHCMYIHVYTNIHHCMYVYTHTSHLLLNGTHVYIRIIILCVWMCYCTVLSL